MSNNDIQRELSQQGRLATLNKTGLLDTLPEASFDRLTRLASHILGTPVSLVSLVEPTRQFLKSHFGVDEPLATQQETPLSHSFCKHVAATGEELVVTDAREHPVLKANPAVDEMNVIAYLGIPLTSEDGWHLGSFCVIDNNPRQWTDEQIATMRDLAAAVMTEINLRLEAHSRADALAELRARNAELDAFAHTVSHNLKNPISAIMGWTSVSERYQDKIPYAELLENMHKINELAHHTSDIIESLLMLAGIGREGAIPCEKIDMFRVLETALNRLQVQIAATGTKLNLPRDFPDAQGYGEWIVEVWDNYISNAIKYGGNPPEITFGADKLDNGQIRYWIKDNGSGIQPDEISELFVPFARLPQSSYVEGHGLGLSIVERIITRLGGEVGVESVPGKGSIFSFTLNTVAK